MTAKLDKLAVEHGVAARYLFVTAVALAIYLRLLGGQLPRLGAPVMRLRRGRLSCLRPRVLRLAAIDEQLSREVAPIVSVRREPETSVPGGGKLECPDEEVIEHHVGVPARSR